MPEPKLFEHLCSLYKLLSEDSEDGVWEGNQLAVFGQLGLSGAYNPILYRGLRELGCVEVLVRGARNKASRLRLIHEPQMDSFVVWNRENISPLTRRATLRSIETRMTQLERRMPEGVTLADWIVGIEARLSAIEKERHGKAKK